MRRCLRTLLTNSIDYAGVFPPAKLALGTAIGNYVHYHSQPVSWMLGRFVCPAGQLEHLHPIRQLEQLQRRHHLAVVGSPAQTAEQALENLRQDVENIRRFDTDHHERLKAASLELKLPHQVLARPQIFALTEFIEAANRIILSAGLLRMCVFYEPPSAEHWHEAILAAVPVIAASTAADLPIGLKLRTGGLHPDDFPSSAEVALFIAACRQSNIAWKATAGLHQPLRHYDAELGVWHHGFLNLLCAAAFAHAHELAENEIQEILEIQSIDPFRFDDHCLGWQDRTVTIDEIQSARTEAFISFGSCSFDEPREGLQSLGLIERDGYTGA